MSESEIGIGARGIRIVDTDSMRKAFSKVNGRAAHFVLDEHDAVSHAAKAERRLESLGVPKCKRVGCAAHVRGAGPSARAYKYRVATTEFTLRRFTDGWRVMSIDRSEAYPGYPGAMSIDVPCDEVARIKIRAVNEAMKGIVSVRPLTATAA